MRYYFMSRVCLLAAAMNFMMAMVYYMQDNLSGALGWIIATAWSLVAFCAYTELTKEE